MSINIEVNKLSKEMSSWRRHIHSQPELGFEEQKTADFIAKKLESFGLAVHRGLGITGVVGTLSAGSSKISIGLRADMDALPMDEENTFSHRSTHPGKMHACGHDGHVAMLLGAAKHLANDQNFNGKVHFIFQPAEEGVGGAKKMIEDGLFEMFPCDSIFAMHNKPGLEVGKFSINAGPTMAAGTFFDIYIEGKGAHAAKPAAAIDPIMIASQLVVSLQSIVSRFVDPQETVVLSVTKFNSGTAYNVIPDTANLAGTIRTLSDELMNFIQNKINEITQSLCDTYGARCIIKFDKKFATLVNHDIETEFCQKICEKLVGQENIVNGVKSMASEDFAFMLQKTPGCYIDIGNGVGEGGCEVHNPLYDFNDDILALGASYFVKIIETKLK